MYRRRAGRDERGCSRHACTSYSYCGRSMYQFMHGMGGFAWVVARVAAEWFPGSFYKSGVAWWSRLHAILPWRACARDRSRLLSSQEGGDVEFLPSRYRGAGLIDELPCLVDDGGNNMPRRRFSKPLRFELLIIIWLGVIASRCTESASCKTQ